MLNSNLPHDILNGIALVVRYGAKVKICEKTVMSAKSLVGIFNYKPTTLSDRRKADPGFTKCPFKLGLYRL